MNNTKDENKKQPTEVQNTAPASQQTVDGELVSGEKVQAVRWFDAEKQEDVYQVNHGGKLYMAKQVSKEPSKFVYELI